MVKTCRGLGETRGEKVVEGEHLEYHVEDDHKTKLHYLCYYTNVPVKGEGMSDILMRFTLKGGLV